MHRPDPLRRLSVALLLLFFSTCLASPARSAEAQSSEIVGHWEGAIELPTGELIVMVDFEVAEVGWAGTIDIPAQGAEDLALGSLAIDGPRVRFSIEGIPGNPTFDGHLEDGEIRGKFSQGGAELDFRLGRDAVEPPARPQMPQPPFPYRSQEVTYENGDVTLAGTLTLPPGDGPFPAVVLITGSGAQDRDESLLGHKPFLVLADHLTRAGIAVLRSDDRGVGGSSGSTRDSTSADFADDALAGVRHLAAHPQVDAARIGLLGHSEGGLVGPLAATRGEGVAYLVLLAGPGVPASDLLPLQVERIALADGASAETAARLVALNREVFTVMAAGLPDDELRRRLIDIGRRQVAIEGGEASDELIAQQIDRLLTPWFRYFIGYDPGIALASVRIPVLALNGELDTQVDAEQNLPAIVAALERAGNRDVTAATLPGLNHLFQHAETGSPNEYAAIEETMDPEVLERVSSWILERFGKADGD